MPILPEHPVYVISKGRADCCLTAKFLVRDETPFRLVVEPQERDAYAKLYGDRVVELPFSNLGLGSIPARNWCWEHAKSFGAKRHWILDDNMHYVCRRWKHGKRIPCQSGPAMFVMERFVERYENVAIAGPNYEFFAPSRTKLPAFRQNVHVYSYLLIDNALPFRWRGRYNEDTDLCLQALAMGLCTVQFQCFLTKKVRTMTMKGGNSAQLYQGDGRLRMANALVRQWPGVVQVKRRFDRPQHYVDWTRFDTPLKLKPGLKHEPVDESIFTLRQMREIKSPALQKLYGEVLKTRAQRVRSAAQSSSQPKAQPKA